MFRKVQINNQKKKENHSFIKDQNIEFDFADIQKVENDENANFYMQRQYAPKERDFVGENSMIYNERGQQKITSPLQQNRGLQYGMNYEKYGKITDPNQIEKSSLYNLLGRAK